MNGLRAQRTRIVASARWWLEWPVTAFVGLAWVLLLAGPGSDGDHPESLAIHAHSGEGAASTGLPDVSGGVMVALPGWTLMAVAMMGPVALPAVRHVGLNSIRRRREWAMALFVGVYVGVWVAFGVVVLAGERLTRKTFSVDARTLLVVALAASAGWQLTRAKRRALLRCRRTVALPPAGYRADSGCARFAFQQGWRCVTSCWALMTVMVLVGPAASLWWMLALTALIAVEELTVLGRRVQRPSAAVLALAAVVVAVGA